jgi:hypothetical protein
MKEFSDTFERYRQEAERKLIIIEVEVWEWVEAVEMKHHAADKRETKN